MRLRFLRRPSTGVRFEPTRYATHSTERALQNPKPKPPSEFEEIRRYLAPQRAELDGLVKMLGGGFFGILQAPDEFLHLTESLVFKRFSLRYPKLHGEKDGCKSTLDDT